jgi:hypothetical protein
MTRFCGGQSYRDLRCLRESLQGRIGTVCIEQILLTALQKQIQQAAPTAIF